MVENSIGRLWLEGNKNEELKSEWEFYVNDEVQELEVSETLHLIQQKFKGKNPEEIKLIDPCMGSGHVLVYAFEVLMQIYNSCGYSQREAASKIIENNLYGVDIDDRAYQLSYFAIMMKGRKYDRQFLGKGIDPNICSIQESNGMEKFESGLDQLELCDNHKYIANYLIDIFRDAKEYGSLLVVENNDYLDLENYFCEIVSQGADNIFLSIWLNSISARIPTLIKQARILSGKYDAVITNPPYFSSSDMSPKLSEYVKCRFPLSKSDMFAVYIEKCRELTKQDGIYSMIILPSIISLSSYKKLRKKIIEENTILNLLHMGRGIFGIDFGSTSFCIRNSQIKNYIGSYFKLHERTFQYIDPEDIKNIFLISKDNKEFKFDFTEYNTDSVIDELIQNQQQNNEHSKIQIKNTIIQSNFGNIPDSPIAYWVNDKVLSTFNKYKLLGESFVTREGMATAGNDIFLKLWHEVNKDNIGFGLKNAEEAIQSYKKWFPYNKGGDYRKWYGNNDYVVNWSNDGYEIRNNIDESTGRIRSHNYNGEFAFSEGLTWSSISAGNISVRYSEEGYLFDSKGAKGFPIKKNEQYSILGLLNSKVAMEFLKIFSPTMDFKVGDVILLPYAEEISQNDRINELVLENIQIAKEDWNFHETSWDFSISPLIRGTTKIEYAYKQWEDECNFRLQKMKDNEEEINKILIGIYDLKDVLTPIVDEKLINLHRPDVKDDIKRLISYFVGCLFGRFNLNTFVDNNIFKTNESNIVQITEVTYVEDSIINKFVDFIKCAYGMENLNENLNYIANALSNTNNNSINTINNYFIKEFFNDHSKMYTNNKSGKRPIYWLFDSGKENGFKALMYMHRYDEDTIGRVRADYLHKQQSFLENAISQCDIVLESNATPADKAKAVKQREKLVKQIAEIKLYDQAMAHMAHKRIPIDLDDGVKVNYAKFQGIEVASEGKKTVKVDLLAKI